MEATITALARQRAPEAFARRPAAPVEGLVWDACAGLPNPPTVPQIMHWTDLARERVEEAVKRLLRAGLIEAAGRVPFDRGARMSYRVVVAA